MSESSSSRELMKTFEYFYYMNVTFSTNELRTVHGGNIPNFINMKSNNKKLLSHRLYELFCGTKFHGIVCIQFLGALKMFLGSDRQNSKDVISGFYRNYCMEALSRSNHSVELDLFYTRDMVK